MFIHICVKLIFWGLLLFLSLPALGFANSADPAVRQKLLAAALRADLKIPNGEGSSKKTYVHWRHLNGDEWIDAIVILKPDQTSCAIRQSCLGLIMVGSATSFHKVLSFTAKHHSLRLGPPVTGKSLRNLFISSDGDIYKKAVFIDDHYRLEGQGMPLGFIEDDAPWSFNESHFDDLDEQISTLEDSESPALGAPFILKVQPPPASDLPPIALLGFNRVKSMKNEIQNFLSELGRTVTLSHSVTVEIATCQDWVVRIPLFNQTAESSKNIVVCSEVMGMVHEDFLKVIIHHYKMPLLGMHLNELKSILIKKELREDQKTHSAFVNELSNRKSQIHKIAVKAIEANFSKELEKWQLKDDKSRLNALFFILAGNLGEALALQDNLTPRLLMELDSDKYMSYDTTVVRNLLKRKERISYLFGFYLLLNMPSFSVDFSSFLSLLNTTAVMLKIEQHILGNSKERDHFTQDLYTRAEDAGCAERGQEKVGERGRPFMNFGNAMAKQKNNKKYWANCNIQLMLLKNVGSEVRGMR